jgi:hypothetical protein
MTGPNGNFNNEEQNEAAKARLTFEGEVREFLKEYDLGLHELSTEGEAALEVASKKFLETLKRRPKSHE